MFHSCRGSVSLLVFMLGASACAPQYYGTVRTEREPLTQAAFDEISSMSRVGLAPLSFSNVRFRNGAKELSEDEAFEGKTGEKRASWNADKAAMAEVYGSALVAGAGSLEIVSVSNVEAAKDVQYVVVPVAVLVDPGYFATALFNAEALLQMQVSIVRVSDKTVVHKWTERETSNLGISSGQRMRSLAAISAQGTFRTLRAFAKPAIEGSPMVKPAKDTTTAANGAGGLRSELP